MHHFMLHSSMFLDVRHCLDEHMLEVAVRSVRRGLDRAEATRRAQLGGSPEGRRRASLIAVNFLGRGRPKLIHASS
jgi:hypothetical protein